jgi:hypothetical protein
MLIFDLKFRFKKHYFYETKNLHINIHVIINQPGLLPEGIEHHDTAKPYMYSNRRKFRTGFGKRSAFGRIGCGSSACVPYPVQSGGKR